VFRRLAIHVVLFAQLALPVEPPQRAFNQPALGLDDETMLPCAAPIDLTSLVQQTLP
jgi:hypothetical protein